MGSRNDIFRATYPYMEGGYAEENKIVVYADSNANPASILSGEHGFFEADDTEGATAWLIGQGCDPAIAADLVSIARTELVSAELYADGSRGKSGPRTPCRES